MTGMLEKAGKAVRMESARQDDVGTFRPELIVRAVLMAIRDLDNETMDVAVAVAQSHQPNVDGQVGYVQVRAAIDAMIDKILSETE